jgi:signal transduction histidine kinase
VDLQDHALPSALTGTQRTTAGSRQFLRRLPIRWRVLTIAALIVVVADIFAGVIWSSAQVLRAARNELRQTRDSDRLLSVLENQANELQSLIHRYFTQPNDDLLKEITELRGSLLDGLRNRAAVDPTLGYSSDDLVKATESFVAGFEELRNVQSTIGATYEHQVLAPAREMSGLYAIIEGATKERTALIWPSLSKSRDSFSTNLVLTNSFYLTRARETAEEITRNLETIEGTIPVMLDLSDNDLQRGALGALGYRAVSWRLGIAQLAESFVLRSQLLRDAIDGNQAAMTQAIDRLSRRMREREQLAFARFERTLYDVYIRIGIVTIVALTIAVLIALAIARSIVRPLRELMNAMHSIVSADYSRPVPDLHARDEIGEMARAVEVFRANAIAKQKAELELKAAKEHAEKALTDLQDAQQSLVEAEKLAALGGLVAGVAHEVNNPVGISLTVASSFARRCDLFEEEVRSGALRRSKLDEFLAGSHEAAKQLVANLNRAADLIQSFKQVAVDRSQADRRPFDLAESSEQIVSSLRPALRRSAITFDVDIPPRIIMDGYPGPYGQVLTNLVLNALAHAFPDRRAGEMRLSAKPTGAREVEIEFSDNGVGMDEGVRQRAFEPFFTTRRNRGGTGLGLHIVYSLVTRRLGGRLRLQSEPGKGTTFLITLPLVAPRDEPDEPLQMAAMAQPT